RRSQSEWKAVSCADGAHLDARQRQGRQVSAIRGYVPVGRIFQVDSLSSLCLKGKAIRLMLQRERAEEFHRLHASDKALVLVNAWDAASARLFEQAGAPAICHD